MLGGPAMLGMPPYPMGLPMGPMPGFDLNSYRQSLEKWNAAIQLMSAQCDAVGPASCLPVRDF